MLPNRKKPEAWRETSSINPTIYLAEIRLNSWIEGASAPIQRMIALKKDGEHYGLGHRERLRQRAASEGFEALRPHEIIELVLFYAQPRVDLTDVARSLIGAMGSVDGVMKANREQLLAVPGVTNRMADWLLMTSKLLKAYTAIRRERQLRIWRFQDIQDFVAKRRMDISDPQVWVVYTDYDDRMLCYLKLGDSICWTDPVYTRDMVEYALAMEAKYIYMVGFTCDEPPELYTREVELLKPLSEGLAAIDVNLMDFILVSKDKIVSLRKTGRFEEADSQPGGIRLKERYFNEGGDV